MAQALGKRVVGPIASIPRTVGILNFDNVLGITSGRVTVPVEPQRAVDRVYRLDAQEAEAFHHRVEGVVSC